MQINVLFLNKSSNRLSTSSTKLIWNQFNVVLVQRNLLTRGRRMLAAPEGQTGNLAGNGS